MLANQEQSQKQPSLLRLFSDNHKQSDMALQHLESLVTNLLEQRNSTETFADDLGAITYFFNHRISESHIDEEVYMYQFILNGSDKKLASIARNLLAEHVWIEDRWALLQTMLRSNIQNCTAQETQTLEYATEAFVRLKRQHMQHEEETIFPAAKKLISKDSVRRIAQILEKRQATYASVGVLTPPNHCHQQ